MRKSHRVHRWRTASKELQSPHRILLCCTYRNCATTRVYDLRESQARDRRIGRAFFRIFGDELTGQETAW